MTVHRVSISLEPEYIERLDAMAKKLGVTRSDFIRKFIATNSNPKVVALSPDNYQRVDAMTPKELNMVVNVVLKNYLDFYDSYVKGKLPVDDGKKLAPARHRDRP